MSISYVDKYIKYKNKYIEAKAEYNLLLNKCVSCKDNKESCNCNKLMLGGAKSNVDLILFKADWCGHCKQFMPVWNQIKDKYNNQNSINIKTFDADSDKSKLQEYNIQGFPTLLLVNNNKVIEYNGDRDLTSVNDFINAYI